MLSKYGFAKQYLKDSFQDNCSSGMIYFPINDSADFPCVIREKAEEIIDNLIGTYEKESGNTLDLSNFSLDARIEIFFDQENIPIENIGIFIGGIDDDLVLEQNMKITPENMLYGLFKSYFLSRIEKTLFEK